MHGHYSHAKFDRVRHQTWRKVFELNQQEATGQGDTFQFAPGDRSGNQVRAGLAELRHAHKLPLDLLAAEVAGHILSHCAIRVSLKLAEGMLEKVCGVIPVLANRVDLSYGGPRRLAKRVDSRDRDVLWQS